MQSLNGLTAKEIHKNVGVLSLFYKLLPIERSSIDSITLTPLGLICASNFLSEVLLFRFCEQKSNGS